MIEFTFTSLSEIGEGKCTYREKDFGLEIYPIHYPEPQIEQNLANQINKNLKIERNSKIFIICKTLTMSFHENNGNFVSFDAYTNRSLWKRSEVNFPQTSRKGILKLLGENLKQFDHTVYPYQPQYEINPKLNVLRINFLEAKDKLVIELTNNLIVALNEKRITDFYIREMVLI